MNVLYAFNIVNYFFLMWINKNNQYFFNYYVFSVRALCWLNTCFGNLKWSGLDPIGGGLPTNTSGARLQHFSLYGTQWNTSPMGSLFKYIKITPPPPPPSYQYQQELYSTGQQCIGSMTKWNKGHLGFQSPEPLQLYFFSSSLSSSNVYHQQRPEKYSTVQAHSGMYCPQVFFLTVYHFMEQCSQLAVKSVRMEQ